MREDERRPAGAPPLEKLHSPETPTGEFRFKKKFNTQMTTVHKLFVRHSYLLIPLFLRFSTFSDCGGSREHVN